MLLFESCNNANLQGGRMKIALGLLLAVSMPAAQTTTDTPEAHVAIAKTAAGADYQNLFNFLCAVPGPRGAGRGAGGGAPRGQGGGQRQQGPPARSTWYAEPVKVFDNMYFVGQSEYSVWAITTSQGIIVIDTIFDYSVEEEVAGGLKRLGLDPANIKYAVVTHPHPDHHGGAKFLRIDMACASSCPPRIGISWRRPRERNQNATWSQRMVRNLPWATQR
jgi:hypothetical protein